MSDKQKIVDKAINTGHAFGLPVLSHVRQQILEHGYTWDDETREYAFMKSLQGWAIRPEPLTLENR